MKRLILALALLGASPAYAAWTYVSVGTLANAPSPFVPGLPAGHASGDLLVWVGFERNSSAAVAIPSGYTELYSITAGAKFFVVAAKIDGGSETAPSTTGSSVLAQIAAFRGGPSSLTGIVHASATSSAVQCTTNPASPALTISQSGTLVLAISYQLDNYSSFTSNPSGFSTIANNPFDGTNDQSLMWARQIQTTATNIAAGNFTTSGAGSSTCRGVTLSLSAGATGGVTDVTSVNTTNSISYTDTNRVATVVAAGATQSTSTFKLIDQGGTVKATQSIDSWADTSIQFDPTQGNVRFGSMTYELVVGANTGTLPGTLTLPGTEWFVDVLNPVTLNFNTAGTFAGRIRGQPNRYYDYPTDIATGDQLHCKRTGGSGTLTLNADGTFSAPSSITQVQCRFWDATSSTWGAFQTWDLTGARPTFTGPNP